jgi:hypothetical protein
MWERLGSNAGHPTTIAAWLPISSHQSQAFVKILTCGLLLRRSTCTWTERDNTIGVVVACVYCVSCAEGTDMASFGAGFVSR